MVFVSRTFKDIFSSGKNVLSFEFFPPKKQEDLPRTYQMISDLNKLDPDFLTVTYGAGGGTRVLTREMVGYIHHTLQKTAVAHLTCVGHSKTEIDEILYSLREQGISNILALRGDPPKGETKFTKHPDGFENAKELTSYIKSKGNFSIAVAGYPELHREALSAESDLLYLKDKVNAGAELIITQLFFNTDFFFRFMERAYKIGINVPILPGIMPISNVAQINRFTSICGATIPPELSRKLSSIEEDENMVINFGMEYALKMCETLLKGGAPGIHLYTLNKSQQIKPLTQAIKQLNL